MQEELSKKKISIINDLSDIDREFILKRNYEDFDDFAVKEILGSVSSFDYVDCLRLLLTQKDSIIDKIYYDLLYEDLPCCAKYEDFENLVINAGGEKEKITQKRNMKAMNIIKQHKKDLKRIKEEIKEAKQTLGNIKQGQKKDEKKTKKIKIKINNLEQKELFLIKEYEKK